MKAKGQDTESICYNWGMWKDLNTGTTHPYTRVLVEEAGKSRIFRRNFQCTANFQYPLQTTGQRGSPLYLKLSESGSSRGALKNLTAFSGFRDRFLKQLRKGKARVCPMWTNLGGGHCPRSELPF